jgi:hypothetical protein
MFECTEPAQLSRRFGGMTSPRYIRLMACKSLFPILRMVRWYWIDDRQPSVEHRPHVGRWRRFALPLNLTSLVNGDASDRSISPISVCPAASITVHRLAAKTLPDRLAQVITNRHILYRKLSLVNFVAAQHNTLVSSNFCKELDLARFYQRAFFCPIFCLPGVRLQAIKFPIRKINCQKKQGMLK